MAYLISEEAKDLLQDVHEFCENEVKEQCKAYDVSGEWPKEIYDKAIEMQLHSLEVPEEYGGPGLSRVDVAALIEEMAIADAGFATTISASGLGTKPVLIAGNEEQKKHVCQKIIDGGFGAFCLTEPGAGSDASAGTFGHGIDPGLYRTGRVITVHILDIRIKLADFSSSPPKLSR